MPVESPAPKLIFGSSVEALLKAGRGAVSAQTEKKLAALGFSFQGKIDPAYPAEKWASAVKLISADLFPADPAESQHRQLGEKTVQQFADTFMGKAMLSLAKVLGTQKSLQRMTHQLRTGANFIETRFTPIDAERNELWINDVSDVPGFYAGLIKAGSDHVSGSIKDMRIKAREGTACLYELRCPK